MSAGAIAALYALGVGLLVTELFTPGLVAGIMGAISLGVSVYFIFAEYGALQGALALVGAVGTTGAIAWIGVRRLTVAHTQDTKRYSVADPALAALGGARGVALSPLRPAGVARFDGAADGRRVDVITRGEMVDAGKPVRVVEVDGTRVIVAAE